MTAVTSITSVEQIKAVLADQPVQADLTASSVPSDTTLKTLLLSSAPSLASLQAEPKTDKEKISYVESLLLYMSQVLKSTLVIAQNRTQLTQNNVDLGTTLIDLSKEIERVVESEISKLKEPPSFWSKLIKGLSYAAGALMVVAGIYTGNPALAFGGVMMIAMTATDAHEALDKALEEAGIPLGGRIVIQLGIALAGSGAASGAKVGAASVKAASAAEKGARVAAASAAASAATATAFSTTTILAQAALFASMTGLWQNMARGSAEIFGANKSEQDDAALWGGLALTITTGLAAGKALSSGALQSTAQSSALMNGMRQAVPILLAFTALASGTMSVVQGAYLLAQAKIREALAEPMAEMKRMQNLSEQNTALLQSINQAGAANQKTYAEINSHWDDYVAPYRLAAQVM